MHNRPDRPHIQGLRAGMEKARYIERKNLILNIESRRNIEDLRAAATLFVVEKFDVIVANSSIETAIAQQATNPVPIVFLPASAPGRAGLVKSLARRGTNLTGVAYYTDFRETGKQIETFKEVVPTLGPLVSLSDASLEQAGDDRRLGFSAPGGRTPAYPAYRKPVESRSQAETVGRYQCCV